GCEPCAGSLDEVHHLLGRASRIGVGRTPRVERSISGDLLVAELEERWNRAIVVLPVRVVGEDLSSDELRVDRRLASPNRIEPLVLPTDVREARAQHITL